MRFIIILTGIMLGSAVTPAHAVFSGAMSPREPSSDADYAAGIKAFDAADWQGVIDNMARVVKRRPHHDNALARIGYANRKLKRYDEALEAYGRALARNPLNRDALEYSGEAYLEMGRLEDARQMLLRLQAECRRIALVFSDGDFKSGCTEYVKLKAMIETFATTGKVGSAW